MGDPRRAGWSDFAAEPFRLLFPVAVVFGGLGALLWPAHLLGWLPWHPGAAHARLLILGFFGGFIAGFLGAALPRLLGAPPARTWELTLLVVLHIAANTAHLFGRIPLGDAISLFQWLAFAIWAATRFRRRADLPPPAFALAAMGVGCLLAGLVLSLAPMEEIPSAARLAWPRLLMNQGFPLLPILGVGAYLFPRVFHTPNRQDFPESRRPGPGWWRRLGAALALGLGVVATFWLEASGWTRVGSGARAGLVVLWAFSELSVHRRGAGPWLEPALLRLALGWMALGLSLVALAPGWRVGWLHLVLMGGFATTLLVVGARVLRGHGGRPQSPAWSGRWLKICVGLLLLAMLTRVSGDLWPKIMRTHYIYGALLWTAALALWSWKTLPEIRWRDPAD